MRTLSAMELLTTWDRGLAQTPVQRALALLAAASPETAADVLARQPLGWRDAQLLALRERLFGSRITTQAACPACGERLESSFSVREIRADSCIAKPAELALAGFRVAFRNPDSTDLAAIERQADVSAARHLLLRRCIQAIAKDGAAAPFEDLPSAVLDAVVDRMAQADPQADIKIALSCPACGHTWAALFDVVNFLWTEIQAWARRILREVHTLASAYGWSESEIVNLSPARRQFYLEMVGR